MTDESRRTRNAAKSNKKALFNRRTVGYNRGREGKKHDNG